MPYKDLENKRRCARESARRRRGSKLAEPKPAEPPARSWPADPGEAFELWSRDLVTPEGHPLAGQPMVAPHFLVKFVRDAMAPGVKEGIISTGRKNSKTGGIAMLALAHLAAGAPFRRPGQRIAVVSLARDKAAETKKAVEDIAVASKLQGLTFLRSPAPGGKVETDDGSELTILAGVEAGTAGGFDLVLIDEAGKMTERHRGLIETTIGATGARRGRVIYLTIYGNGIFTQPLVDRADDPAVVVHLYQPDKGARIDDEAQWKRGNPGLGTIKDLEHMRALCRKARVDRSYRRTFLSEEMNVPQDPVADSIVTLDEWAAVQDAGEAAAVGPAYLGIDIGGSSSACAAALYFPETGLLKVCGAWPKQPTLYDRGLSDGVGDRYERMHECGEIVLVGDVWADAGAFVAHVMEWTAAYDVREFLADRYRHKEVLQALIAAECPWPITWRRMGKGTDGTADIQAFRREVSEGRLRPGRSLFLESAIAEARVDEDKNNNCSLERARWRGRIDALSAAVLAVGAGSQVEPAGEMYHYRPAQPAYA